MIGIEENLIDPCSLRIPVDRVVLEGCLSAPKDAAGLVLLAYGSGSSQYSNQRLAQTIREAGFAVLLVNLLTHVEAAVAPVTQAIRFNIPLLAERLIKATEWISRLPAVEHLPIGYLSSSTDSGATLIAAAALGARIGAIVSYSGRVDLASDLLPAIQSPTLLVVGESDDLIFKLNRQAYQKLVCEKRLAIVSGSTRGFQESGALAAVSEVAIAWFKRYLSPPVLRGSADRRLMMTIADGAGNNL